MSDEVLVQVMDKFSKWARDNPDEPLTFTWHGGEPLVPGAKFYERVIELQELSFGKARKGIKNQIQSNLTLLTPELLDVMQRLMGDGSGFGTSYDIIEGIRLLSGDQSYEQKWHRGAELLHRRGIRFGVGYVVHKESLSKAKELYYFCKNLGHGAPLRANPLYHVGRACDEDAQQHHITPEEYGRFLMDLAQVWEDDGRQLQVEPLREWVSALEGKSHNIVCESSGNCQTTHIGIGPDGTVSNCGRAQDSRILVYGSIVTDTLDEIMASRESSPLNQRLEQLAGGACAGCDCWHWCQGGCPADGHAHRGDYMERTVWCEARKMVAKQYDASTRQSSRATRPPGQRREGGDKSKPNSQKRYRKPVPKRPQFQPGQLTIPWSLLEKPETRAIVKRLGFPSLVVGIADSSDADRAEHSLPTADFGLLTFRTTDPGLIPALSRLPGTVRFTWDPETTALGEVLESLKAAKDRSIVVVLPAHGQFLDPALVVASLGYSVALEFSQAAPFDRWQASQLLDYALHTPTLAVPIDPFFSMVGTRVSGGPGNWWQMAGQTPGAAFYATRRGEVSVSKPMAEAGHYLGTLADPPATWMQSELWDRWTGWEWHSRKEGLPCATCPSFALCGGFIQALPDAKPADCDPVKEILGQVEEAAAILRRQREGGTP